MKTDIWKDNKTLPENDDDLIFITDDSCIHIGYYRTFDGSFLDANSNELFHSIEIEKWIFVKDSVNIIYQYQEQSSKIERLTKALDIAKKFIKTVEDGEQLDNFGICEEATETLDKITQALDKKD